MQGKQEFIGEASRTIVYTLGFTAKTYLFGPVADNPSGLIKKVDVDSTTSNMLNKGNAEVPRTPDRSMVSRERKTPSIQSSLHSSRQPC